MKIKAPFPAFGGKSQVVDLVWERLGNPRNYVEPFAFTAVMMLQRPTIGPIETINDLNAFVANFWRAIKSDPEAVAVHADNPVNETDLHARHRWLARSDEAASRLERVRAEPDYFDAKIAGWWCWGACCWIGSGWCETQQLPHMDKAGRGVATHQKRPMISCDGSEFGRGINGEMDDGKRPALCNGNTTGGPGLNRVIDDSHRPQLADAFSRGRGVNGNDSAGTCENRSRWIREWFVSLADRLRPVRVCCGHWARVCDSPSTLTRLGTTGVFLDPPYRHSIDGKKNRTKAIYANDGIQDVNALCDEVQTWCMKWGNDPEIRIALCGLEGEYPELEKAGWDKVAWKSNGGYGNQSGEVNENAARERIWFNAACLKPSPPVQNEMFGGT